MFGGGHKIGLRELINNCVMLVQPELDLSQRDLRELPADLLVSVNKGLLGGLEVLKLQNNQLGCLPGDLGLLTSLRVLLVEYNRLHDEGSGAGESSALPAGLAGLARLEHLDASHNQLTGLSDALCQAWGRLQRLVLASNAITVLPAQLGSLSALTELNVAQNRLERLPASLGGLVNLRVLIADSNQLVELPTSVGSLAQLTFLSLTNNRLRALPEELLACTQLATVHATANPKLAGLPLALSKLYKSEILKTVTVSATARIDPRWRANPADIIDFLRFVTHFRIAVDPKAHWQPNDDIAACPDCQEPFSWMRRRHHCRICGRVMCDPCTQNAMMIDCLDSWSPSRLCKTCFQLTRSSKAIGSKSVAPPTTTAAAASSSPSSTAASSTKPVSTTPPAAASNPWQLSDADRASLPPALQRQKLSNNIDTLRAAVDKKQKEAANLKKLLGFYQNDPAGRAGVEKTLEQLNRELDEQQTILDDLSFQLTTFLLDDTSSSSSSSSSSGTAQPPAQPVAVVPASPARHSAALESSSEVDYATCVALFDYESADSNILSFREGERMTILNDEDPSWIYVALNGQEGYVPATYVERAE